MSAFFQGQSSQDVNKLIQDFCAFQQQQQQQQQHQQQQHQQQHIKLK